MVTEWWEKQTMWPSEYNTAKAAWQAAQAAERERTTAIMLKHVGSSMRPWNECVADAIDEINELEP